MRSLAWPRVPPPPLASAVPARAAAWPRRAPRARRSSAAARPRERSWWRWRAEGQPQRATLSTTPTRPEQRQRHHTKMRTRTRTRTRSNEKWSVNPNLSDLHPGRGVNSKRPHHWVPAQRRRRKLRHGKEPALLCASAPVGERGVVGEGAAHHGRRCSDEGARRVSGRAGHRAAARAIAARET
jgi:hypothetical protein